VKGGLEGIPLILGTYLKKPNPGFNPGFTPPPQINYIKGWVNPELNPGFDVLRFRLWWATIVTISHVGRLTGGEYICR
jgi:hypothetical protein